MALTDAKLRALKGQERPVKIGDGEGLYVLIKPNGSKLWALAYRFLGKQKTLALGKYPTVSLLDARHARDNAKRLLASAIFRYGVATARCQRDVTTDLRGALKPSPPPKHRTALPADDLPKLVQALEAYEGDAVTKLAMKLMLHTFVRTSELRFAKWCEFEGLDTEEPLWRIPAARMKMRRDHLVPLARQTVEIIEMLRKRTGNSEYLFPAPTKRAVISENTLLFALYRMGYHRRATIHGFRATASTVLNEAQFNRDWIEMQLAHFDGSVRGVYNAAVWLPMRRQMMSWWVDFLEGSRKVRLELVANS